MPTDDTIAAVASGWGASPRALIRLSGPGVPRLLDELADPPPPGAGVWTAALRLAPARTLPVLILRYAALRSYTGEDSAELLVPGSPALLERIMALLTARAGVREATPGEFSARAFLAGRLTLAQAEGVAALIAARTDEQLDAARRLLAGTTGERYARWADELATLLALVEAGIDFTDQEDVVPIPPDDLAARLTELGRRIRELLGASRGLHRPDMRPTVVLAGAPNAGKSTLFNALLGYRRAVTSPVAGTTRDVLAEPLDLSDALPGGPTVTLVDLAGLGGPDASPADAGAQEAAAAALRDADVLLHCDPSGRFGALPAPAGAPAGAAAIRVRTKADLPVAGPGANAHESGAVSVCALDGRNLPVLRRAIADAAWGSRAGASGSWLLPRHRRALSLALVRLDEAGALIPPDGRGPLPAPELIAGLLREALDALAELAGRISPDDIVGRVFATFCVGK